MRFASTLSGKLTLVFGGLFAAALLTIFGGVRIGIANFAERAAQTEMAASADAFEALWQQRYKQLAEEVDLLASDFGFRRAAATGDAPTIISAVQNLADRGGRPLAFYVDQEGRVAGNTPLSAAESQRLFTALNDGRETGILAAGGQAYGAVAVAVRAPTEIGWVVFGTDLSDADLESLVGLASPYLQARVYRAGNIPAEFRTVPAGERMPTAIDIGGAAHLVRAVSLPALADGAGSYVLFMDFSLDAATAQYRSIFVMIGLIGLAGLAFVSVATWLAARRMTRPIGTLDRAVQNISAGGRDVVTINTGDEIERLARSFNDMVQSVSEREQAIAHMAFHDALTGLPNRKLFQERLDIALEEEGDVAVLAVDLDNFKAVNDTLGHPIGDRFLCGIAQRLQRECEGHFVARMGGDEFAVLVAGGDVGRQSEQLARRLIAAIGQPVFVEDQELVSGASIGIAIAPQDGTDADDLFKNADLALYRVKAVGRGEVRFFEAGMDAAAKERRALELDLRAAIENGDLSLDFQPLFHLEKNRITEFEALVRWRHATRGNVQPSDFIPIAEDTGLIIQLGEYVLDEALRQVSSWPDDVSVAVNLSAKQFRSPALIPMIETLLAHHGVAPERLELEITESLFIENLEDTLASLGGLRALGVHVALDDFGTGYSSLSYLRKFPFDKLKIDRSFITDLGISPNAGKIVNAIAQLANALGMEITAEGVEDEAQLSIIREQGCTHIQGYYFSRPVAASAVSALIEVTNGRPELIAPALARTG